jgi:hypothetical protein
MSRATSSSKFSTFIAAMALLSWLASSLAVSAVPPRNRCRMPRTAAMRCRRCRWRDPARYPHRCGFDLQQYRRRLGLLCVPDERAALDAEIGRLQATMSESKTELEKLRAELAAREPVVTGKIDEALPKTDSLKKAEPKVAEGERKIEIPLPSDRDMDRVMSFLEQAWRRLVEMANRMQKDVSGKI